MIHHKAMNTLYIIISVINIIPLRKLHKQNEITLKTQLLFVDKMQDFTIMHDCPCDIDTCIQR